MTEIHCSRKTMIITTLYYYCPKYEVACVGFCKARIHQESCGLSLDRKSNKKKKTSAEI